LFKTLPDFIQDELLLERQSNAALQMSQLETERLLAVLVEEELKHRKKEGTYKGSFSPVCQFIGYQARCSVPSNFDMDYAYSLGATSAILATTDRSGYMAIVSNLAHPVDQWAAGGVPLTALLHVPHSSAGEAFAPRPNIFPHRVDLDGAAFRAWLDQRAECARSELYENPGPIQLAGPCAEAPAVSISSKFSYLKELASLTAALGVVGRRCRPGADSKTVRIAMQSINMLNSVLDELAGHHDCVELKER